MYDEIAERSSLGKQATYESTYNKALLFPIPRAEKRIEIGISPSNPPFIGYDCWNHYEVSWLNEKGKPMVGVAEISYDCNSPNIVESKSLKLYFNSFNNTKIQSMEALISIITKDLEDEIKTPVLVKLHLLHEIKNSELTPAFSGESIDYLDVECSLYMVEPNYLTVENEVVEEELYSDLLKSNCLVTNQPDWGSVHIAYTGKKINRDGLLKYIVSFRNHNEFHEQCIERIFMDIMNHCKPEKLVVYGRYTRRGGLDINPYRATKNVDIQYTNMRLIRQ